MPKSVLVVGVYLANRPNGIEEIVPSLSQSNNYRVTQCWAALGGDSDHPSVREVTVERHQQDIPKFRLLNQLLAKLDLAEFEFVVMMDDDITLPNAFLDNYLDAQTTLDFALAQPARSVRSHYDHFFSVQVPDLFARETRWVEIGPVVSIHRSIIPLITPFDPSSPMGWGYENVWAYELFQRKLKMGIIDAYPVEHCLRPHRSHYDAREAAAGRSRLLQQRPHLIDQECQCVIARHSEKPHLSPQLPNQTPIQESTSLLQPDCDNAVFQNVNRSDVGNRVVDVVITSHNYGRFLAECIASIKSQSHLGKLILINDRSADNTSRFCGVVDDYVEVSLGKPLQSRLFGLTRTTSPFVLFVDADNMLSADFLSNSLQAIAANDKVAIVYSDLQYFGNDTRLIQAPKCFDKAQFERSNFLDTCCVFRKDALQQILPLPSAVYHHEDWFMWKTLLSSGRWEAVYQPSPLLYRRHQIQRSVIYPKMSFFERKNYQAEVVTIFTTYSKRVALKPHLWERRLRWFEDQSWPRDQIRLIIANTSGGPAPAKLPRELMGTSIYNHNLTPGHEDAPRWGRMDNENAVQTIVAAIYNRAFQECRTNIMLTLEDDVFYDGPDLIERMLRLFEPDVCAVAGNYRLRYQPCAYSHFYFQRAGQPEPVMQPGKGVVPISGCGFGCTMVRKDLMQLPFFGNSEYSRYYDVAFWIRMGSKYRILLDWSLRCEHVGVPVDQPRSQRNRPVKAESSRTGDSSK